MTSIVVWVGVDQRGPASINIASDSRITFMAGSTRRQVWDQGRKIFGCLTKPHLFGYFGDVLFPALALPTVVEQLDRDLLGSDDHVTDSVYQLIRSLAVGYPALGTLGILHAFRIGEAMASKFCLNVLRYDEKTKDWSRTIAPTPTRSAFLAIDGSGRQAVRDAKHLWDVSESADTSRAAYSSFCEGITSGKDINTGGAPQLGSLYRIGPAHLIGTVFNNKRHFSGARLVGSENVESVEWRNDLFERLDGARKKRLPSAQVHPPR